MNKKIAIIGANKPLLPFYEQAHNLGYELYGFAWEEGAVCKKFCKQFFPISFTEKEHILELCDKIGIDGITSFSLESALPTVIYVAQKLGLVSNTLNSLRYTKDKYAMRERMLQCGLPIPKYTLVRTVNECENIAMKFPLVVKPVDGGGKKSVSLANDMLSLKDAVKYALNSSKVQEVLIEEYLFGKEVSVEYLSFEGVHYYVAITDKVSSGPPHFIELGHHQPTLFDDDIIRKVKQVVEKLLDSLEIYNSPSHTELKITDSGDVYVIETGARLGGDRITSDIVKLSTGYDLVEGAIELATGKLLPPPDAHIEDIQAGIWFYTPQTEWVKKYLNNGNICSSSTIIEVGVNEVVNQEVLSNADRNGYFIYKGKNRIEK